MNGTLTETCMYLGGAIGSLLALHYEMSLWGVFFVFGMALGGAVIGAGIKAAWIIRRSGRKFSIKIHVKDREDYDSQLPGE